MNNKLKISVLDLSPVREGETRHQALSNTVSFAREVEELGYHRFWVAEHHASSFSAGRSPEVLIPLIAAQTKKIRVGSGAVLLNHYSALKVAENFCSLEEMFPGRIDLGVGRATTGPTLDNALQQLKDRKNKIDSSNQIMELSCWLNEGFDEEHPYSKFPLEGDGHSPEFHVLGTSAWSAQIAGQLGLPYTYAAFLNQSSTQEVFESYFRNFTPSDQRTGIKEPEIIFATQIICGHNDEAAQRNLAPIHLLSHSISNNERFRRMQYPEEAIRLMGQLPPLETYKKGSGKPPKYIAGSPERVANMLEDLRTDLGFTEIMIKDIMTDHTARSTSFRMISEIVQ